jgi:hypothetical protein
VDNDLMDRWVSCTWGVDCETHRQALSEIQQLRDDLALAPDQEDIDDLDTRLLKAIEAAQGWQVQLGAERARSAELLRRIEAIVDFAQEKAA